MIPSKIKNLFNFIEYLYSEKENFKKQDDAVKEVLKLDKDRKKINPNANYESKLKYDEIQKQLETKFSNTKNHIILPIKAKARDLGICDFSKEPIYICNKVKDEITTFKRECNDEDVAEVLNYKNKYKEFKKEFIGDCFNPTFWEDLNNVLKDLFDYFNKSETEFDKFLKQFDSEAQFSDFENIVKQFSEKEIEQKPPYIFEKLKEPYRVGNGNHLMVPYIPLNFFKDELGLRLKKELVDRKEVIKYFRDTYIQKSLKDSRYKSIYDNLKSGNETFIILQNSNDRFCHYAKVITVKELIKLELYLNELENTKTVTVNESKQDEIQFGIPKFLDADAVISDLKIYFNDIHNDDLGSLINGNTIQSKITFKDNANKLGTYFKDLFEMQRVSNCSKQNLISWIACNFNYYNIKSKEVKNLTEKYLENIISNKQNIISTCKNPIQIKS